MPEDKDKEEETMFDLVKDEESFLFGLLMGLYHLREHLNPLTTKVAFDELASAVGETAACVGFAMAKVKKMDVMGMAVRIGAISTLISSASAANREERHGHN
jgi:hypothetical protein